MTCTGGGRDKCVSFVLKRIEAVQPFSKSSCYLIEFAFKHDSFEYFLQRALGFFFRQNQLHSFRRLRPLSHMKRHVYTTRCFLNDQAM